MDNPDYARLIRVNYQCDLIKFLVKSAMLKPEKLDVYSSAMVILADEVLKTLHQLQTEPND